MVLFDHCLSSASNGIYVDPHPSPYYTRKHGASVVPTLSFAAADAGGMHAGNSFFARPPSLPCSCYASGESARGVDRQTRPARAM